MSETKPSKYRVEEYKGEFYPQVWDGYEYQYVDGGDNSEHAPSKTYAKSFSCLSAAKVFCVEHESSEPKYHLV